MGFGKSRPLRQTADSLCAETLNPKIHLLAEGMGALIADQLLQSSPEHIRSAAMLDPCLDLQAHFESEKENKFFYKQFLRETAQSFGVSEKEASSLSYQTITGCRTRAPVHIWQRTTGAPYPYTLHANAYKEAREKTGSKTDITYHLLENPARMYRAICRFFRSHEKDL